MAAHNSREIGLIHEHEVIRAEVKLLITSLAALADQKTAVSTRAGSQLDEMKSYRLRMHDLRDGIRRHIELDERLATLLQLGSRGDALLKEHAVIQQQVDEVVQLADNTVDNVLDEEKLAEFRSALDDRLGRIRELVETHTATEDALFQST